MEETYDEWCEKLNKEGFFLQKRIKCIIDEVLGYVTSEEVPTPIAEKLGMKETPIDIQLSIEGKEKYEFFFMVIECKKVYNKEWLFLKSLTEMGSSSLKFRQITRPPDLFITPSSFREISLDSIKFSGNDTHEICEQGFEREIGKSRASTDTILHAGKQLALGIYQTIEDVLNSIPKNFDYEKSRPANVTFIPMIITNASLIVSEYDPSKIDIESGNIEKEAISMQYRPWLIYDYQVPSNLVHPDFVELEVSSRSLDDLRIMNWVFYLIASRLNILVVQAKKLKELLLKLEEIITIRKNNKSK